MDGVKIAEFAETVDTVGSEDTVGIVETAERIAGKIDSKAVETGNRRHQIERLASQRHQR